MTVQPTRPSNLSEYAIICLQAIAKQNWGEKISLGGALGLLHYLDYRSTHDVDAWWTDAATSNDQRQLIQLIEATLMPFGQVRTRAWGDVTSIELQQAGHTIFSFQIAHRSVQLQPGQFAPWTAVLLDSFVDLVASKMVALVERGAPRDFRDIYALCQAGLIPMPACWRLWQQRQQLAGSDTDHMRATLAVQMHLERIIQHRPLEKIHDPEAQGAANRVRTWFIEEFLHANPQ